MAKSNRKLILYIAQSIDGYVATEDDDITFLSTVEVPGEDYGYSDFKESIDTCITGRVTYEIVKEMLGGKFPQAEEYRTIVITRQVRLPENGVTFYHGDLKTLVDKLKSEKGKKKNIYCDGGPLLVASLLREGLIDEMIISTIPVMLGEGKRLFREELPSTNWIVTDTQTFESGLVQIRYTKKID